MDGVEVYLNADLRAKSGNISEGCQEGHIESTGSQLKLRLIKRC